MSGFNLIVKLLSISISSSLILFSNASSEKLIKDFLISSITGKLDIINNNNEMMDYIGKTI